MVTAFDSGDDNPGLSLNFATMEVMTVDGSDSYTHNGALGGFGSDWAADRYYGPILTAIDDAKRQVLADMEAIAEAFWQERRKTIELMNATGKAGLATRFISLTLSVTNNRGTATARWMDLHVKRGKTSMASRRTTNRGSNYHIGTLKRGNPDELHPAIETAEMMLRDLRMYQRQIARAKRHLKVADATNAEEPSPPPSFLDDPNLWSWAKVPTQDHD